MTYWVRDGALLNFLAFLPPAAVDADRPDARRVVAELRSRFDGCTPELERIVGVVDAPFVTAIHDRAPLSRWSRGRVTLLGDAAHPMHPFLGQGANMAIEDAATLAVAVARRGEGAVDEALRDYERLRLPRTSKVGSEARVRGEALLLRDPAAIAARNRRLQAMRESDPFAEAAWGWVWRYDAVDAARADIRAVPASA
jgi:salicylate hydroxylase